MQCKINTNTGLTIERLTSLAARRAVLAWENLYLLTYLLDRICVQCTNVMLLCTDYIVQKQIVGRNLQNVFTGGI